MKSKIEINISVIDDGPVVMRCQGQNTSKGKALDALEDAYLSTVAQLMRKDLSKAEQEEAESDMEILIRSLRERQSKEAYEQIKLAASQLSVRNEIGLGLFTKGPEPYERDQTYRYRHDPSDLLMALAAIADRSERRLPPPVSNFAGIVGAEPYPVVKKAAEIVRRLFSHGVMRLKALFQGSRSRSEIVATFLALLELCKLKSVSIDDADDPSITYLKDPDEPVSAG